MVIMEKTTVELMRREFTGFVGSLENNPALYHSALDELRQKVGIDGKFIDYGNYAFMPTTRNRSSTLTVYPNSSDFTLQNTSKKQKEIIKNDSNRIELVHYRIKRPTLIRMKRGMYDSPYFTPKCKIFHSVQRKDSMRIKLLLNTKKGKDPSFPIYNICVSELQEICMQIQVFPEIGDAFLDIFQK